MSSPHSQLIGGGRVDAASGGTCAVPVAAGESGSEGLLEYLETMTHHTGGLV